MAPIFEFSKEEACEIIERKCSRAGSRSFFSANFCNFQKSFSALKTWKNLDF